MSRSLAFLSTLPLLAMAAQAQCLGAVTGTAVPLTPTTGLYPADDEGISAAVPLGFVFPMAGTLGGGLDHAFVSSNGEIYLTNATYGLTAPVGGVPLYGFDTLAELRGTVGSNPRVAGFAADHEAGSGMTWGIFVDTTVANEVTFRFHDMTDYFGTLSCDWSVKLLASGAMEFTYGATMPNGSSSGVGNIAGVSIGNAVGTGGEPPLDLTSNQDSGALGLLYETWGWGVPNDLAHKTILIVPNGLGGFFSTVTCQGAFHLEYGAGCYNLPSSVYQLFGTAATASVALTGNALSLTNTGTGYLANWLPGVAGALYVVPSGTATALPTSNDGSHTIAPSVPLTVPGGSEANVTINHNGIITAGLVSNNDFDWTPAGADLAAATARAFYAWHDYADFDTGSGLIKHEEATVGGSQILYVTWDNVDMYPLNMPHSNTLQFQINLTSGDVMILWTVVDPDSTSLDGSAHLVGYTGPGAGADPGSQNLATALPQVVQDVELAPLELSASPAPVFAPAGPSVPITYQVDNLRDLSPALPGFYLATLVFSFNGPIIPGGIDLTFVGVDAPGCNLLVGTLDVLYNISPTASSHGEIVVVPQPLSPGTTFYVQAANFILPNSLPNGLNNFGIIVSNGVQSKFDLF